MVESQSILSSYRWPRTRWWILGGLSLLAAIASFRFVTDTSPIYQLATVLVVLGLLFRPEKRLQLVEDADSVVVQSAYSWNIIRRHGLFQPDFVASRESAKRSEPYELNWRDWWAAVRNGGRMEQHSGHAILVGVKRRGIAIPIDERTARLAVNLDIVASGTTDRTSHISIGWGLFERQRTETTERRPATFVFVPIAESAEDIRKLLQHR